ncbi:MAG: hypothetical protein OIF50_10625 [Flavobacteriaceae bacterium]|nr:hypothetical protein [Flavobacteriaceae bacterium]
MKKNLLTLALLFSGLCLVSAQDDADDTHNVSITIPEVALVDVESASSTNISFDFVAPTEAGDPLTAPADNTSLTLNYSSIVSTADPTRTIKVSIDSEIDGVDITLAAAAYSGSGEGATGTPAGAALVLSTSEATLISGIGSCYTGNGTANGHQLTYGLEVVGATASYEDLTQGSNSVTVTYTISDI